MGILLRADVRRGEGRSAVADKQGHPASLVGSDHVCLPNEPRPGPVPGRSSRRRR